jgi:hypothetical protein
LLKLVPASGAMTIEAEASGNTIAGAARIATCAACSGGRKVGFIGNGAANFVTVDNVDESSAGTKTLTFTYLLSGSRTFDISVNGGTDIVVNLTGTSFATPVQDSIPVTLKAGPNTIKFHNDTAFAPDLDTITVG